jgi:16S rRNA (guanine966-N2)-methyltransferase
VRVIAGELGGRKLEAPRGRETRPTSDRVREALFMALEPLADLRVVDLFAGSGALGIEALSRGAAHADFAERRGPTLAVLERNLERLDLRDRARVWSVDLERGLKPLRDAIAQADLVLLDPPYHRGHAHAVLDELGRMELRARIRVVVEHHSKESMPEGVGRLVRVRQRVYGETVITTYAEQEP